MAPVIQVPSWASFAKREIPFKSDTPGLWSCLFRSEILRREAAPAYTERVPSRGRAAQRVRNRAPRAAAAIALSVLLAAAAGCGSNSALSAPSGGENMRVTDGEIAEITISNFEVPGPAADRDPGVPNRVGSARVPVRGYEPSVEPWATLVWAHGGSFLRGTLDWPEADWTARRFAEVGLRVYSVDYALASDSVKAPAPSNDVAAVVNWAAGSGAEAGADVGASDAADAGRREPTAGPLVVGGASAGAHLATLAVLDVAAGAGSGAELGSAAAPHGSGSEGSAAVSALLLEYPTLHRVQRPDAAVAAATARLPEQRRFSAERIAEMYSYYLGDATAAAAVAGELPSERLALLPPTVIVNADADELRASGEQFAEQLRAAGVDVREFVQPDTVHGYLNRPEESAQTRADVQATIDRFVAELRDVLGA